MKRGKISFMICMALLIGLTPYVVAQSDTVLNISNSKPYLDENIPNVTILVNSSAVNAFDLDDYFVDDNGEDLTYTYTNLSNVTVTINSGNQVSFYPDTGYSGVQQMQFFASDGVDNASSNDVYVTVFTDLEAPKWSDPARSKVSIFQNTHVNFTTSWTDDGGLEKYIVSVNQGSGWENESAVLFSGTSNTSNYKIQISAAAETVVYWRIFAADETGKWNATSIQNFTVQEFDSSDADSSSSETGTTQPQQTLSGGLATEDVEVDISDIKITLKQGEGVSRVVQITNNKNETLSFNASLNGMSKFAFLSEEEFSIESGETFELLVEFKISEDETPDQYFGSLIIDYGTKISIPIVLDVKPFNAAIELTVNLSEKSDYLSIGEEVLATVTIVNLKDVKLTEGQLYYALKDYEGTVYGYENENISVFDLYQEDKVLTVPDGTPTGKYLFYARVILGDLVDLDSDSLTIGKRFTILGFIRLFFYPLLILILLLFLIVLIATYRRSKKKKRLLELYLLLNELRSLVKKGKTAEALNVYKRIKIFNNDALKNIPHENEAALKKELEKFSEVLKSHPPIEEETTKKEASSSSKKEDGKEKGDSSNVKKEPSSEDKEPQKEPPTKTKKKEAVASKESKEENKETIKKETPPKEKKEETIDDGKQPETSKENSVKKEKDSSQQKEPVEETKESETKEKEGEDEQKT